MSTLLEDFQTELTEVFYDTDHGLAETVAVTAGGSISGVFVSEYRETDLDGFGPIVGASPTLRVLDSDAALVDIGETITIRSTLYEVINKQPNSRYETILILHDATAVIVAGSLIYLENNTDELVLENLDNLITQ